MFCCNKCCKGFNTNWQLQRHYGKKRPCEKVPAKELVSPQETPISPQETPISPQETPIKCEYCCQEFSRVDNFNRHEAVCKERQCVVRHLEVQLGIQLEIDIHSKQCRFCKKEFSQKCHCTRHIRTCKAKEEYRIRLQKELQNRLKPQGRWNTTINNTTNNNNNITNIINVNSLGQENIDYITTKTLMQLVKKSRSAEELLAMTLNIIHGHKDHPENHNIVYTNLKSNAALVKLGDTFEYKNINDTLRNLSANTLDHIVLDPQFDDLSLGIKQKYENVCDDDEMNKKAVNLTKIELYNSYKSGNVKKP